MIASCVIEKSGTRKGSGFFLPPFYLFPAIGPSDAEVDPLLAVSDQPFGTAS